MTEPPDAFLGIDLIWPNKNRDLGRKLTYACPYRTGTSRQNLKCTLHYSYTIKTGSLKNDCLVQYVYCKWDKDTDEMVWWPPYIDECNSKYQKYKLLTRHFQFFKLPSSD